MVMTGIMKISLAEKQGQTEMRERIKLHNDRKLQTSKINHEEQWNKEHTKY